MTENQATPDDRQRLTPPVVGPVYTEEQWYLTDRATVLNSPADLLRAAGYDDPDAFYTGVEHKAEAQYELIDGITAADLDDDHVELIFYADSGHAMGFWLKFPFTWGDFRSEVGDTVNLLWEACAVELRAEAFAQLIETMDAAGGVTAVQMVALSNTCMLTGYSATIQADLLRKIAVHLAEYGIAATRLSRRLDSWTLLYKLGTPIERTLKRARVASW